MLPSKKGTQGLLISQIKITNEASNNKIVNKLLSLLLKSTFR